MVILFFVLFIVGQCVILNVKYDELNFIICARKMFETIKFVTALVFFEGGEGLPFDKASKIYAVHFSNDRIVK